MREKWRGSLFLSSFNICHLLVPVRSHEKSSSLLMKILFFMRRYLPLFEERDFSSLLRPSVLRSEREGGFHGGISIPSIDLSVFIHENKSYLSMLRIDHIK